MATMVFLSGALASGCTTTPSSFPPCVNPYQGCDEDAGGDAAPDAADAAPALDATPDADDAAAE